MYSIAKTTLTGPGSCKQERAVSRPDAFTLIELLIVIAIIAILASILLPVLAKAQQRGDRAYCMNNMHQLAAAWIMYADDNNSYIALNADTSDQTINSWVKGIMKWDFRPQPRGRTTTTRPIFTAACSAPTAAVPSAFINVPATGKRRKGATRA